MARILLVEDSRAQAEVTIQSLEKSGYDVTWGKDGVSAIKAVKSTPPDIILLDLELPDMSGKEVCRFLKNSSDTRGIPIIMLTVSASLNDKVSGIEAGADDYLPKPYNEVELNAKIYAALRTKALQDELRQKNVQLSELLARVEALAVTDPLTGLFNRRHFESALETEWKRVKRFGQPITCLMVDIDHFKLVNDGYGHKAGDSVIQAIAQILKNSVREVDTVARWGGEEFIVILSHTGREQGMPVARRILERVSGHEFEQVPGKSITVSIGLASSGPARQTSDELFNAADAALYEAKRKGRNRIEFAI